MPRETSYTNTREKEKDDLRERQKWFKTWQCRHSGLPRNKWLPRRSPELWQMSCLAVKPSSQPTPTHFPPNHRARRFLCTVNGVRI